MDARTPSSIHPSIPSSPSIRTSLEFTNWKPRSRYDKSGSTNETLANYRGPGMDFCCCRLLIKRGRGRKTRGTTRSTTLFAFSFSSKSNRGRIERKREMYIYKREKEGNEIGGEKERKERMVVVRSDDIRFASFLLENITSRR